MKKKPETYWRPQVVRHIQDDREEFAIHEVYFSDYGKTADAMTIHSLTPRFESIKALRKYIQRFLKSGRKRIRCGESNHDYSKSDVLLWSKHVNDRVFEIPDRWK